jgi:hypothetical protein
LEGSILSLGKWHEAVPRGPLDNLRWRKMVLERAEGDPALQADLMAVCGQDILFWINTFVFTYNPRSVHRVWPFCTFDFQDRAVLKILQCVEEQRDLVVLKSREMGASWLCMIVQDWLTIFKPRNKFLSVTRNAALVDDPADPDSLFWKLDFIHKYLPSWMLEADKLKRKKMSYVYEKSQSTINGQATTGAAGVGGRATAMFIDEFSRIEEAAELYQSTADTTGCRIFNFTFTDNVNTAYQLSERDNIEKLRMHWSEHPHKNRGLYQYDLQANKLNRLDLKFEYPVDFNFVMDGKLRSPWYDAECKRRANSRDIAMNLDIDAKGAMYQFFDTIMVKDIVGELCREPYWEGDIEFDEDTGKFHRFVKRQGGPVKLWCHLDGQGFPPWCPYGAGADISAGTGATPSVLSVSNCQTGEKVLEYANAFIKPERFAALCVAVCQQFHGPQDGGALFAWEQQGPGEALGKRVVELHYPYVYYNERNAALPHLGNPITDKPGWYPNNTARRVLLEEYRADLSNRRFLNRSFPALEETLSFIYRPNGTVEHSGVTDTDDPSGARMNHGDRVIADALCAKMVRTRAVRREHTKPEDKVPLLSLEWRREYHKRRDRDNREEWAE